MEISQMQALVAAVERGSFAKAAEHLMTTPQTIKNQIDSLEFEVKTPLFIRSNKGIVPTDEASFLYKQCRLILENVEKTLLDVALLGESKGVVIAIPRHNDQPIRDRLFADFTKAWPDIPLRYIVRDQSQNLVDALIAGDANVTFCIGKTVPPDGFETHLFRNLPPIQLFAVVVKEDVLASRENLSPDCFAGRSIALYQQSDIFGGLEPYVTKVHIINDFHEAVEFCRNGGICFDTDYNPLQDKDLVRIPVDVPDERLYIVVRSHPTVPVARFVDYCTTCSLTESEMHEIDSASK